MLPQIKDIHDRLYRKFLQLESDYEPSDNFVNLAHSCQSAQFEVTALLANAGYNNIEIPHLRSHSPNFRTQCRTFIFELEEIIESLEDEAKINKKETLNAHIKMIELQVELIKQSRPSQLAGYYQMLQDMHPSLIIPLIRQHEDTFSSFHNLGSTQFLTPIAKIESYISSLKAVERYI